MSLARLQKAHVLNLECMHLSHLLQSNLSLELHYLVIKMHYSILLAGLVAFVAAAPMEMQNMQQEKGAMSHGKMISRPIFLCFQSLRSYSQDEHGARHDGRQ